MTLDFSLSFFGLLYRNNNNNPCVRNCCSWKQSGEEEKLQGPGIVGGFIVDRAEMRVHRARGAVMDDHN